MPEVPPRPAAARAFGRLPLLLPGMLALLAGVLSGLARLAWPVPDIAAAQAAMHAALMVGAFFGTVISLERAVALGRRWAYLAPVAAGLAGIGLLAGAPLALVQAGLLLASLLLLAASLLVLRRLRVNFTVVLALAAGCWLAGNLAWMAGASVLPALPWWLAFLSLTIAAERLELTRLLRTPPLAKQVFLLPVALILAAAVLSLWLPQAGWRGFALGLLLLACWLMGFDIARRNIRQRGLTRFIAVALLGGYVWLALAGLLGLAGSFEPGHAWRDAALHAIGLGFVFSMVFGHAPIIFPAVARVKIPWHPVLYVPLLALHISLLCRVAGGLWGDFTVRRAAGLLNALVLLGFILVLLARIWRGKHPRKEAGHGSSQ